MSARRAREASPTPFHSALEAVVAPLEFAARDDFAHLSRVKGIAGAVRGAAQRMAAARVPADVVSRLDRISRLFDTDADAAAEPDPEALRAAIAQALKLLEPLRDPGFPEAALARSVEVLPGVGAKRAQGLARRGLGTIASLLFRLPIAYEDRSEAGAIGSLEIGRRATFEGEVKLAGFVPVRGPSRRLFQAVVDDGTGKILLTWFRGGETQKARLVKGARVRATGDVRRYRFDKQVVHPEVDVLGDGEESVREAVLVPRYSVPEGVPPRTFRRLVSLAVEQYTDLVESHLPGAVARERDLPAAAEALALLHRPPHDAPGDVLEPRESAAFERLVLEELYLLEVGLLARRDGRRAGSAAPVKRSDRALARARAALPFSLTPAQERVLGELLRDLSEPNPMWRLLQGDVGSGKTAVAWLAAVAAADAGLQTALMAPTELLAEQHHRTLAALRGDALRPRVGLLTASQPRPDTEAVQQGLAEGTLDLVVGTHALVQEGLRFARLGLVVIDEQHRFGVLQRAALAAKAPRGLEPHVLVMTATPIPRSLALTVYGDLDLSIIDELPPGREPVQTRLLRSGQGEQVLELVRATLGRGEQAYVVYPLVEESEKVDLRAATESTERIRAALPDYAVDLVHGRLDAAARAQAMARFERGETRLLVSTTVIEVGVDVPEATLMVVEHAERFGLAQLHQLRGRVGRGGRPGTCVLVARGGSEDSEARLRAMLETTDGFRIADADLTIRGPGEFLGTRQSGRLPDLRIADLVRDARLVAVAREAASATLRERPLSARPALARVVALRWGDRIGLAGVG
jgi:ATP-dependent DNA helicase RecG